MKKIINFLKQLKRLANIIKYLLTNLRVDIGIEYKPYYSSNIKITYLTIRNKVQNKDYLTIKINEKGDCRIIVKRGLIIDSEILIVNTNKMNDKEINRIIEETVNIQDSNNILYENLLSQPCQK